MYNTVLFLHRPLTVYLYIHMYICKYQASTPQSEIKKIKQTVTIISNLIQRKSAGAVDLHLCCSSATRVYVLFKSYLANFNILFYKKQEN